jgi:hypothetical protein
VTVRRVCVLVVLVGCGRISFELYGVDDGGASDGALRDTSGDALGDSGGVDVALACNSVTNCQSAGAFVMCNGRCVAHCQATLTQADASALCTNWGGTLQVLRDPADLACSQTLAATPVWIGYTQQASAAAPAAGWQWVDAQAWPAPAWSATEPNDLDGAENGQEQCARLLGDGTTGDVDCAGTLELMCTR